MSQRWKNIWRLAEKYLLCTWSRVAARWGTSPARWRAWRWRSWRCAPPGRCWARRPPAGQSEVSTVVTWPLSANHSSPGSASPPPGTRRPRDPRQSSRSCRGGWKYYIKIVHQRSKISSKKPWHEAYLQLYKYDVNTLRAAACTSLRRWWGRPPAGSPE